MLSNRTRTILDEEYPEDWPEVEYLTLSSYLGDGNFPSIADPQDGTMYATMVVVLLTPRSRGAVTITSPDVAVSPDIDPAFLTDRADVEVSIEGFKRARESWQADALDGLLRGDERYPGSDIDGDLAIEQSIRNSFQTIFHGPCTTRNLPPAADLVIIGSDIAAPPQPTVSVKGLQPQRHHARG
jgi:choline dehydrogenase